MEPIHVLVLDTVMDRGGAETMIMNYMRNIDRDVIKFDFMVNRDYRAAYEYEIESLGGKIYRMCPMYPQYFEKYKRQIREFLIAHPEYKIIHSNLEERSYFALKEASKIGVPVRISHAHNVPRDTGAKKLMRYYFRSQLNHYNTHMFACGVEAGDWLYGKDNRDKVVIMNNAIEAEKYTYSPEKERIEKEKLGLTGKFVIGHVGRFFPQKNHEFLIDIFKSLYDKRPDSVLVLVGGGEKDDALKNRIKEKVSQMGLTDSVLFLGVREDVNEIMQAFDVFLLPSLEETFGRVYVEAMTQGLPVIYTKNQGFDGNFEDGVVGYAIDSQNPQEIANRVIDIVNNYDVIQQNCVRLCSNFFEGEIINKLDIFYKESLKRG